MLSPPFLLTLSSQAFWICLTTHLGTCAYGSLVIPFMSSLRFVLKHVARRAARYENTAAKCVKGILLWFVNLHQGYLRFISKDAYVITALYGYEFSRACRRSFFLYKRNMEAVSTMKMVANLILLIGKVFVSMSVTVLYYLTIAYESNGRDTYGIVSPCAFVWLISYFVATMFAEIFSMGIQTLLLCYVSDLEMFQASERFAELELIATIKRVQHRRLEMKKIKRELKSGLFTVQPNAPVMDELDQQAAFMTFS